MMTFLTSPNFSHSVRRSSRYSFRIRGSSCDTDTEWIIVRIDSEFVCCVCVYCPHFTSKSLGWNMFLMMTTFSCLFLASPCFSGLQSNCLHRQRHRHGHFWQIHLLLFHCCLGQSERRLPNKIIYFTCAADASSFYNLCSSSSSCWHHTGPLTQTLLLPHGVYILALRTHQSDAQPGLQTLSVKIQTHILRSHNWLVTNTCTFKDVYRHLKWD